MSEPFKDHFNLCGCVCFFFIHHICLKKLNALSLLTVYYEGENAISFSIKLEI